jgi:hypothetical protein
MNYKDMSLCAGSNCKRKNKCKRHKEYKNWMKSDTPYASVFEVNNPDECEQFI